jgi:cytoskeletal protein CcmA (bactofilin family)
MNGSKLKSGALQYAIFVSVLIAIVVFAFMSLSFLQSKLRVRSNSFKNAISNANQAFELTKREEVPYGIYYPKTLNDLNRRTKIEKSTWGAFELLKVHSDFHNESFRKAALMGGLAKDKPALYLQDLNRPLVLVGNTRIEGNVHLPLKGVKRGSIKGKSYYGEELIYGPIYTSGGSLPSLNNRYSVLNQIDSLLEIEEIVTLESQVSSDLVNSFFDKTIILGSHATIDSQESKFIGNLILHSDTSIFVSNKSVIEDVILSAPVIIVEEGFEGSFQALAKDRIEIGRNCKLNYPSSLVLIDKEIQPTENTSKQIVIQENCDIRGVVAYFSETGKESNSSQIFVGEDSTIVGEVYCELNTELKGTIQGMISTKGFVHFQGSASYQNHIFNGRILGNLLPEQYCGLDIGNSAKGVAKWLY